MKNRKPFALAGLWDVWRKPNRKQVESFTVIMTEPNELDGLFTTACLFSSDRETKSNGLMLLERLSLKPSVVEALS